MRTSALVVTVGAFVVGSVLVSFGCNTKEEQAPAPSAVPVAVPPPPPVIIPPPPAPVPPPPPPPPAKAAVRSDAAVAPASGVRADAAAMPPPMVGFPVLPGVPPLDPSALPGIASGIVGGIMKALPPPVVVAPPAPSP